MVRSEIYQDQIADNHYNLTVSIGFYKQGLFAGDAEKYIDKLTNVDIGIILLEETE